VPALVWKSSCGRTSFLKEAGQRNRRDSRLAIGAKIQVNALAFDRPRRGLIQSVSGFADATPHLTLLGGPAEPRAGL